LLQCFLGILLPGSGYPNNDRCTDIGISSATDRLSDRERVKKLTFECRRISSKTMMNGSKSRDRPPRSNFLIDWRIRIDSKSGIEKSVDQDGVKN
jgi:hypothetical protein